MAIPSPSVFLSWLRIRLGGMSPGAALADIIRRGAAISPTGITCRGKTDGGGAQVHAVISALALARATGLTYYHSPFSSIAHAEGDEAEWVKRWEDFFRLGEGERMLAPEDEARCVKLKDFIKAPAMWRGRDVIVEAEHFTGFTDANVDALAVSLPDIRRKYARSDKSGLTLHRDTGRLTMNVHVRRGDVSADHPQHSNRFTADETVLETIRTVREAAEAEGAALAVNIWSQGKRTDFAAYEAAGCKLFLDTDIFETIYNLTQSDVLLMAKSSLSYVAALLNEGICLYEDFWHSPLPNWVRIGSPVNLATDDFRAALRARRQDDQTSRITGG